MTIGLAELRKLVRVVLPRRTRDVLRQGYFSAAERGWQAVAVRGGPVRRCVGRQPRLGADQPPKIVCDPSSNTAWAGQPAPARAIPRIAWLYWHDTPRPASIDKALVVLRHADPTIEVRVLSRRTIHEWLPNFVAVDERCSIQHMTDLLRLELLVAYGGVWIDAGMIFSSSLDSLFPGLWHEQGPVFDLAGFSLDRFTTNPDRPIVENWFLAAAPGSALVADWLEALSPMRHGGAAALNEQLRADPDYDSYRQKLIMPEYLVSHIALQRVLASRSYRLYLRSADQSALSVHMANALNEYRIGIAMFGLPWEGPLPTVVKFRGSERRQLAAFEARSAIHPRSLYSRLMARADK